MATRILPRAATISLASERISRAAKTRRWRVGRALRAADHDIVLDGDDTWGRPGSSFSLFPLDPTFDPTAKEHLSVPYIHRDRRHIYIGRSLQRALDLSADISGLRLRFHTNFVDNARTPPSLRISCSASARW